MKFVINQKALAEGLSIATSVVAARTPKPILQCVKIEAEDKLVRLNTTDQEIGIRYEIHDVQVSRPGVTAIYASKLAEIVREATEETLTFELEDTVCHIRESNSHFQVHSQSVDDFPPVAKMKNNPQLEVEGATLRRLIDHTLFAAAKENTRYAINGVLWERKGQTLKMVATDGRRLALMNAELLKTEGEDASAIVPTKAMNVLAKVLRDDDTVAIRLESNQVLMKTRHATISSVLIEGYFPKYADVIPKDGDKKVEVSTHELLSAVRRAALLTNEDSKGIRLALTDKAMVLSSSAPDQGEARITMPLDYTGEEMEIGFNPVFLVDALRMVENDQIHLELKADNRPGLFKADGEFEYVVMPVSLS
jgi:DNA polymerase-3 subunit beta